jgi:hypothetical protein
VIDLTGLKVQAGAIGATAGTFLAAEAVLPGDMWLLPVVLLLCPLAYSGTYDLLARRAGLLGDIEDDADAGTEADQ